MKNRIEKLKRKIKILEREKEECDKKLSKLFYPFGIFRILKRSIRKGALDLQKLSRLLKMEIKDLYEELAQIKNRQ